MERTFPISASPAEIPGTDPRYRPMTIPSTTPPMNRNMMVPLIRQDHLSTVGRKTLRGQGAAVKMSIKLSGTRAGRGTRSGLQRLTRQVGRAHQELIDGARALAPLAD